MWRFSALVWLASVLPAAAAEQAVRPVWQSGAFLVPRIVFVVCAVVITAGILLARRGRRFTIRAIPGMEAIGEAIGRATEMGRPSLFSIGVSSMDHPETFASMPLLAHIARISASMRNRLMIPVCDARTLTLLDSTYREACQRAGEPGAYSPKDMRFLPGGQFYFAAAAMGWMLEERPAACFYFGYWEAESLMLSETGQMVGALQIAATTQLYQVPFFIAACDYVIIGEEFFAMSAHIGKEPALCGSLFGQDVLKTVLMIILLAGALAASVPAWQSPLRQLVQMLSP